MAIYQNQAALYSTNGVRLSNIANGEVTEGLSITKRVVDDDYSENGALTYVISLTNSAATAATGLTVSDNLGAYTFGTDPEETLYPLAYVADSILYYQNGVLQAAPTVNAGPPMTVTGINVPAGGNVQLVYAARVTDNAPLEAGSTIVNTASAANALIDTEEVTATATVDTYTDLYITKWISPETVTEGGEVEYTFLIQNYGNEAATTAAAIRIVDTFDPTIDITAVTLNDTPFTSYTYTNSVFSSTAGAITVPAAAFEQNADGAWTTTPGETVLVIRGNIA